MVYSPNTNVTGMPKKRLWRKRFFSWLANNQMSRWKFAYTNLVEGRSILVGNSETCLALYLCVYLYLHLYLLATLVGHCTPLSSEPCPGRPKWFWQLFSAKINSRRKNSMGKHYGWRWWRRNDWAVEKMSFKNYNELRKTWWVQCIGSTLTNRIFGNEKHNFCMRLRSDSSPKFSQLQLEI